MLDVLGNPFGYMIMNMTRIILKDLGTDSDFIGIGAYNMWVGTSEVVQWVKALDANADLS